MPKIGEIKRGHEINKRSDHNHIWHACLDCRKERWVLLIRDHPVNKRCIQCAQKLNGINKRGKNNPNWRGVRRVDSQGRVKIRLYPDDFFYLMADSRGDVKEHRLIVAKTLNRCLKSWEIVHHINENKLDNRPRNLELIDNADVHNTITILSRKVTYQTQLIENLREKIRFLKGGSNDR